MQPGTLAFRITLVLVASFVLLQLAVLAVTGLSGRSRESGSLGLPDAAQMRAMIELVEALPPARRAAAVEAFDGAFYHATVENAPPPPSVESLQGMDIGRAYSLALPDRRLSVTGRVARFPTITQLNPWPGWWRNDPLALHIALAGERPTTLTIESQPSEPVRRLLRQRAALLGLGGFVALVALSLAVRATTQPLVRLSRDIRTFRGEPDSPDLAVAGSRELRELAEAYNEMKERIAELIGERTRILAAVAHDMRTYITRFRLRAEFIDDPDQRERAASDLEEMAALLDDTLLFARTEARAQGERRTLDLAEELRRLAEIHKELGDPVSVSCAATAARVRVAPVAIRRILGNLVDNGLRHAGAVHLTLGGEGARWRIDVTDDGPGVSAEQLAQLGRPFGRVDPSRDRATGGAGLGLAIVRGLVAAEGGEIAFGNRVEGGFVATVWLPSTEADAPRAA